MCYNYLLSCTTTVIDIVTISVDVVTSEIVDVTVMFVALLPNTRVYELSGG